MLTTAGSLALVDCRPAHDAFIVRRLRAAGDYSSFLNAASLKGVRIGVMRHYSGFHEEVDALFERCHS